MVNIRQAELNKSIIKLVVILILLFLLLCGIYFATRYLRKSNLLTEPISIKSIQYSDNCNVNIELSSNETIVIDIKDKVISKDCSKSPSPVISTDGKYAAFEIRMITEDPTMKFGANDNTVFVYIASKKDWAKVYEYGAAIADKLTISSNNSLFVDLSYEDRPAGTKEFLLSEIEEQFERKK